MFDEDQATEAQPEDCTIEIKEDCVIVALDGVRSEVHGREAVRGVKRAVATQLLQAISQVPYFREQERERRQYERLASESQQAINRGGLIAGGAGQAELARAMRRGL